VRRRGAPVAAALAAAALVAALAAAALVTALAAALSEPASGGVRRWNPPYEERFVLGPTAKGIRNDGTIDEGVLEDGQTNL